LILSRVTLRLLRLEFETADAFSVTHSPNNFIYPVAQLVSAKAIEGELAALDVQISEVALITVRKAAIQGNALAQTILGDIFRHDKGVQQNYQQAASWYRKAAEQGLAEAQFNLGNMYRYGKGVSQDNKEAVRWYRKAGEQGYAEAQFNLGIMYATGAGIACTS
jgi:hypothetical protein